MSLIRPKYEIQAAGVTFLSFACTCAKIRHSRKPLLLCGWFWSVLLAMSPLELWQTLVCLFMHLCLFQLWLKANWLAPPATSPHNCAVSALLKSLTDRQHLWLCNGTKMWILSCNNNVYDVIIWRPGYNYCLNSVFIRLRGLFLVLSWITASVCTHALQYSLLINPMPQNG